MSERTRILQLRARLARDAPGVRRGIGDDAAVLEVPSEAGGKSTNTTALIWTIDAQIEGTHFETRWISWEDVGWRSFMAAASDLAAMGADPIAALAALVLAPSVDDDALDAIARGQAAASLAVGAPVVGGNLARGRETSITTTLFGRAAAPVLRTGARAGDGLWLAGPVGLAAAGLALLMETASLEDVLRREPKLDPHVAVCLEAWRRPTARIAEGRGLPGVAHAAIDVSDGLAHDAWQLAEASDVHLVLDGDAIVEAAGEALVRVASALRRAPLDLALHGGEDYALIAASAVALPGFVKIGSVAIAGKAGADARVFLETAGGLEPLTPRGFDHFA